MPAICPGSGSNFHLIRLANGIADELIASANRAQPHWKTLFEGRAIEIRQLAERASQGISIWYNPLFLDYLMTWVSSSTWPVVEGRSDGVKLDVPERLVKPLIGAGVIETFEFFMMDRAACCCATLGSNDRDQNFGLMINCPAWMQLASMPEHFDYFARQLRMVVHHEMAHFRYKKAGLRAEQIAHCRGIASLLPIGQFPNSVGDLLATFRRSFPEILANADCDQLFREIPTTAFRLVRIWSKLGEVANANIA